MDLNQENYKAWRISEENFPKDGTIEEQIKFLLNYAILAPSTYNTQPWRFKIVGNNLEVSPNWDYQLSQADPEAKNSFISLGCATANIISAGAYFDFNTKIIYKGQDKKSSSVEINFRKDKEVDKSFALLFSSITKRFSNKLPYIRKKQIKEENIRKLESVSFNDANSFFITDSEVMKEIAKLHTKEILSYSGNSEFSKELSAWLRSNDTKEEDGMPGFVSGFNSIQSKIGAFLSKILPMPTKTAAKKDYDLMLSSAVLGIIATDEDRVSSWIDSGIAYEKLALLSTSMNISTTVMNALVQKDETAIKLSHIFKTNKKPQLFFRLGYSINNVFHTPRRGLNQFLD